MNLDTIIQAALYTFYALGAASLGVPSFFFVLSLLVRKVGVAHAVIAASFDQFRTLLLNKWIGLGVVGPAIFYLVLMRRWNGQILPPTNPTLRDLAHLTIVNVIYFWMGVGVAQSAGFNVLLLDVIELPEIRRHFRISLISVLLLSLPLAIVATRFPGPMCSFGVAAAVVISLYHKQERLRFIAMTRRLHANLASDDSIAELWMEPFVLLLSDAHLTATGKDRTEGGKSGNRNLELLVNDGPRKLPRYLGVTGDLVDTGAPIEYGHPVEPLRCLRRRGVRVIVCPGNHDLGTAYAVGTAYAFLSASKSDLRVVDTSRLLSYLKFAAEMEPDLKCDDGKLLEDVWRNETSAIVRLQKHWQEVANEASAHLTKLGHRHLSNLAPSAIAALSSVDSATTAALLDPLIDDVMEYFAPPEFVAGAAGRQQFRTLLTLSNECEFDPRFVAIRHKRLWTTIFPLRLFIEEDGLEFLIVNSVVSEPGLVGSAFGRLNSNQLEQLGDAVSHTRARVLIVLMHHPIYGWEQEKDDARNLFRVNTERWGLLAHDLQESRKLFKIFKGAPTNCKHIFLCGGHRHGQARAGAITLSEDRESVDPRLRVCESNALPNLTQTAHLRHNNDLLFLKNEDGLIYPSRIGFDSLLGLK